MTRPVMPDDEAFDYLPTQAVADFLATQNEPQLDGIVFRSVQVKGGRNVVLFHKAARVEMLTFPEGTEFDVRSGFDTEDGWERDYSVSERVPAVPVQSDAEDHYDWFGPGLSYNSRNPDCRDTALRVDPVSVTVCDIDWVSFRSTTHKVSRHRLEKRDPEF